MTHNQQRVEWYKEGTYALLSGVLYGSTSVAVGHPFDTIKTKMQAQTTYLTSGGFLQTLRSVWRNEGLVGLYRGWLPPLWGSSVYRSLQFAVYEALYTKWDNPQMNASIPYTAGVQLRVVTAGLVAATSRAIIESPVEYAKVNRQTGQTWAFKDVYRGFTMQWWRTGGLMTSYFIMLDSVRRHTRALDSSAGQFLASGCCATTAFWVVWPFEVIKNQIQAGTKGAGETVAERLRYLVQHHGPQGLVRGIVPGSVSIFLRNGAAMVVMQTAQRKFTDWGFRK